MGTRIIINVNDKNGKHKRHKLGSQYNIENFKILSIMGQITVPFDKNILPGTLVPLDQNNQPLDLSFLIPDTDNYGVTDTNVASVEKVSNGVFNVKRATPQGGGVVVNYSAQSTNGHTINGQDEIVFEAPPAPQAVGLTASYSDPQ